MIDRGKRPGKAKNPTTTIKSKHAEWMAENTSCPYPVGINIDVAPEIHYHNYHFHLPPPHSSSRSPRSYWRSGQSVTWLSFFDILDYSPTWNFTPTPLRDGRKLQLEKIYYAWMESKKGLLRISWNKQTTMTSNWMERRQSVEWKEVKLLKRRKSNCWKDDKQLNGKHNRQLNGKTIGWRENQHYLNFGSGSSKNVVKNNRMIKTNALTMEQMSLTWQNQRS